MNLLGCISMQSNSTSEDEPSNNIQRCGRRQRVYRKSYQSIPVDQEISEKLRENERRSCEFADDHCATDHCSEWNPKKQHAIEEIGSGSDDEVSSYCRYYIVLISYCCL
jgi:hypothetical protein